MSANLTELLKWFPSGTAEGERTILERVFVYVDQFEGLMAPPEGNPLLLIGSKGSGKSAILDFMMRIFRQQAIPAVLLTPFDIDTSQIKEAASTGDMARQFYSVLMSAIAAKLSEESTGWFDGDRATLYREAIAAGERSPDLLGRMGKFLAEIAKPLTKVDLNAAFPHLTSVTKRELGEAIGRALDRRSFYLLIDDTDQIASPDKPGHLNRVWALMLAARRLSAQIPEVRCVISLRNEVWERLQVDPLGQRDQTDHFRSLCVYLRLDRSHIGSIVERRLGLAAECVGQPGSLYGPFFEGHGAKAPNSPDPKSWKDLVTVRSRERPRDAIQMVNALARKSSERQETLISEGTFQAIMPSFSRNVSLDFANEVSLECPTALEILQTFASVNYDQGSFTLSAEGAKEHFQSVMSRFGIVLYGQTLQHNDEGSAFALWRFFYQCGVLNARVSDTSEKDGYRHLDPAREPNLVSKARWNDLQAMLWEVNTVYRDYLIILQTEAASRVGLAFKPTAGSRRSKRRRS